mgnify:CR=1 FL=1
MIVVSCRHGHKEPGRDRSLTVRGVAAAKEAGRWLREEAGLVADPVISSHWKRCQETAALVAPGRPVRVLQGVPTVWDRWEALVGSLRAEVGDGAVLLVGSHPTQDMLSARFDLGLKRTNYCAVIVLSDASGDWRVQSHHPGHPK